MSDIFFTSDTHFGHTNIIKYDNRPFANVEEHDEALIERWNAVVRPIDIVWHLGDFAFCKDPERIVARLNGHKHLLLGNHDRANIKNCEGWESIRSPYHELKQRIGDHRQKIVLSHYPLMTWNGAHKKPGAWMLHGHCHGTLQAPETTRLDMGTMEWGYAPAALEEVAEIMATRSYLVCDQHQERVRPCSACKGEKTQRTTTRGETEARRPDGDGWLIDGPLKQEVGHVSRRWFRTCVHCDGKGTT